MQRCGANQEPAIFPLSPTQTHFILVGFLTTLVHKPFFYDSWSVFGMNRARWVFNILFQRKSGIVHPTLIEEINGTIRPHAPGHGGNWVDNKPGATFTL